MSIFTSLLNFSYAHCLSICGVLVPFSLLMTFTSLYHVGARHPRQHLYLTAGLASLTASFMIFHVWSWWIIGVIMVPTYILSIVAVVCLAINSWAISHQTSLLQVLMPCVAVSRSAYAKLVHR
ncbi:hypothetical protein C1752_03683 [Acaryochloris thomasi RCC1774]|uniref:Uncharacterized protein n=1 Tax=Acaryochloris thomasi RCC1774 TaxID=1764569 RepID=A0A2W1JFX9_9CYAN|nr:hypothetical protein [Acaryochloris thomasi]PZD72499.1 hypothetical protein C1752_03683 [Acaryochloris thomasi RCC1774]